MTLPMKIKIRPQADQGGGHTPDKFELYTEVADPAYSHINLGLINLITIGSPSVPVSWIFETLEEAMDYVYDTNAVNAVSLLDDYYNGDRFFHLDGRLHTDTQTEVQIQTDLEALNKSDIDLGNVDNTSDAAKPVSTATQTALDGKASSTHTHVANDITDATTVGKAILTASTGATARAAIGAGTATISTQSHIADAPTDCPTDAATDAPTDSPTNLTVLSILSNEVNATNGKQNTGFAIVNANATKQNSGFTKVNTGFAKLNAVLDALEANAVLAA